MITQTERAALACGAACAAGPVKTIPMSSIRAIANRRMLSSERFISVVILLISLTVALAMSTCCNQSAMSMDVLHHTSGAQVIPMTGINTGTNVALAMNQWAKPTAAPYSGLGRGCGATTPLDCSRGVLHV